MLNHRLLLLSLLVCQLFSTSVMVRAAEPAAATPKFSAVDLEFFEQKVRPILVERCQECHNSKEADPKGGLRLDQYQAVLKGGDTGPAVVPGDLKKSLLIDAVQYGDLYQMPPKNKLPAAEVATLVEWVNRGAPWPTETIEQTKQPTVFNLAERKKAHWCWQPIQAPEPPTVRTKDWPLDPLDQFILAKLETQQLAPASNADRRTLVRRAYHDLHGLPVPAHDSLAEQFIQSGTPEAWKMLVEHLLASPRFGEHWARYWLDLMRYAESYGHEFDYNIPQAWQYRDYVIRAFNADVPFDQLAREHIAGDLLPQPRLHPTEKFNESIIGTGFYYLGEQTHSPVDLPAFTADRVDNMIDVLTKSFLGLTVSCARCHDHKFDAISTRDYYALTGIIRSSREQVAYLDPDQKAERAAAEIEQHVTVARQKQTDYWATIPSDSAVQLSQELELALQLPSDANAEQIQATLAATKSTVPVKRLERWLQALDDPALKSPTHPGWFARRIQTGGKPLEEFTAAAPASTSAELTLLQNQELDPGWTKTGTAFSATAVKVGETVWPSVNGTATPQLLKPGTVDTRRLHPSFRGVLRSKPFIVPASGTISYYVAGQGSEIRVIVEGYRMDAFNSLIFKDLIKKIDQPELKWVTQSGDLKKYAGLRAHLEIIDDGPGWIALEQIQLTAKPTQTNPELSDLFMLQYEQAALQTKTGWAKRYLKAMNSTFSAARENRLSGARWELFRWLLTHELLPLDAATGQQVQAEIQKHRQFSARLVEQLPAVKTCLAAHDGPGHDFPIAIRGNYKTPGETAPRRLLTALTGEDAAPYPADHCGRLELARDITSSQNPLFARVIINRLWQQLFDRGIVATADNFGVLGQAPTHPELLDRLATDFQQSNYSLKQMLRRLMLSQTYQQSSQRVANARQLDPQNNWLAGQRLKRISGEVLHDSLLQLGGNLKHELYGPSIPIHLTSFMEGRGRPGESGPLDNGGRRMIYQAVRRNFVSPLALAFDRPLPVSTVGHRHQSNVPAQSLIVMNDPFVRKQCELWASRILKQQDLNTQQRIKLMLQEAWGRPAELSEIALAEEFLLQQAAALEITGTASLQHVGLWSDLAQVIVNSKEFLFIP